MSPGRPPWALGHQQDRRLEAACQLQGRCNQSKWQSPRAQNVPAPDNRCHLPWGCILGRRLKWGHPGPPDCWRGWRGMPERQEREPSLGPEPVPGPNQSRGLAALVPWPRASVAPVARDQKQEGLGPRLRTSCIQGGGPGSGDSLSSLTPLYGSLSQVSVPPWRETAGRGRFGEGGRVY